MNSGLEILYSDRRILVKWDCTKFVKTNVENDIVKVLDNHPVLDVVLIETSNVYKGMKEIQRTEDKKNK